MNVPPLGRGATMASFYALTEGDFKALCDHHITARTKPNGDVMYELKTMRHGKRQVVSAGVRAEYAACPRRRRLCQDLILRTAFREGLL